MTNVLGQDLGPYRVESELGCGGMGTVFTATVVGQAPGIEEGGRVALKVIHPHLLASPGYFKRFLLEADVGRKVRHPNVVRTFEVDAIEIDGQVVHYLVMEYVEGKTLRQYLREIDAVPEPILREIALQTAAGLAAIHSKKIVHRDIKPENILITDDHEIRIMDLGVAKVLEAPVSASGVDQFAGSMLYGAPEQFQGAALGPAADLYSLGVTLYELATGDLPFRRDTQAAVIDAHLHHAPPPLAHKNPELTQFFSALVGKLLAKQPKDRFPSAQALHLAMEEAEESTWWASTDYEVLADDDVVPPIPVRRQTGLQGREDVLATLGQAWTDAKGGRGGVVFIEGEAGIGKTRVLDAFARSLVKDDLQILYGSYPPAGGPGAISDAIVAKFGEAELCDALAPYLPTAPALVPAFASVVTQSGPRPGGEALTWNGFIAMCVHLLQALAAEQPLLWLVDDLHFAPKESRDLVLALARAVAGRPVLLVVTARPGLPDDEMAHLGTIENFTRVPLNRLGARQVVELLRSALLSETLADRLGGPVAYKSDGVPYFIFEMIRGLEHGRYIEQRPDGSFVQTRVIEDIEVPSAVKDLIQGRLHDLEPEQRAILDIGAVQGFRFDPALAAEVLGLKRVRVLQAIAQIERRTGLVRGAVGEVVFDQHQIQEVLYVALIPDLRREYHGLLAAAYAARLPAEPTETDCAFLASHYLQGSEPERGVPYLRRALDHLARTYRNEALIVLAGRALDLVDHFDAATRVDILLRKASRLGLLGRREQEHRALDDAAAIADEADDPSLRARARVALAAYLLDTSQFTEALQVAERTLTIATDSELEGRAEEVVGRALLNLGRPAEARPHFERGLAIAQENKDVAVESIATGDLGLLEKSVGNYAAARAHFERQLAIALETGDRQTEASATGNIGTAYRAVGRFEDAREYLERHRALARTIGDRMGESNATGNLGLVLKNLGRLEEARALFEESLVISREIGHRIGEARAAGHLGLVARAIGHHEEAQTFFERSRDLSRELGDSHGEVIAMGNLGNILFDLGRYEAALAHYAQWRTKARELGDRLGESVAVGNLGNALDALGRTEEALRRFEQSRLIAVEIGDREGEGIALADLGAVFLKLGDAERAKEHLERSLAIVRELGVRRTEGYVLHGLGAVAAQTGDDEGAKRQFEDARDLYRAIHFAVGEAETELALGRLGLDRVHLERALASGRGLDMPSIFVPAACHLGAAEAEAWLARFEGCMSMEARMEAHHMLWKTTGDAAHLVEAHGLLAELRAGAAAEFRGSMVANVPLHRDIMEAWERHGRTA
ncbi:MAG: serine/threonine-protein kinase [Planctomycetota bacterium]|jgi:tetratricopeptide (TPR) repeat protein